MPGTKDALGLAAMTNLTELNSIKTPVAKFPASLREPLARAIKDVELSSFGVKDQNKLTNTPSHV